MLQDSNLSLRPPSPLTKSANRSSGTTFCCATNTPRNLSMFIAVPIEQSCTIWKHTMPRSEPGLLVMCFHMVGAQGFEPIKYRVTFWPLRDWHLYQVTLHFSMLLKLCYASSLPLTILHQEQFFFYCFYHAMSLFANDN